MNNIITQVSDYLKDFYEAEFAVLFGSFAAAKERDLSDIDIAVKLSNYDLVQVGSHIVNLEQLTNRKIDFIILNDLYKNDPLLAYEIITKGKIIHCRDQEKFVGYKTNTFLYYFDTAQLRMSTDQSFKERLENDNFGRRNYA